MRQWGAYRTEQAPLGAHAGRLSIQGSAVGWMTKTRERRIVSPGLCSCIGVRAGKMSDPPGPARRAPAGVSTQIEPASR